VDGRLIIRNERVETVDKLVSENPATLEPLGEVSLASEILCGKALQAAKEAFPAWRETSPRERGRIFKRAEEILLRRSGEAGRLISLEKGSPYPESLSVEVFGCLEALNYYAGHQAGLVRSRRGRHHVPLLYNKRSAFRFHPLGPTLVISPWNFPFLIPFCDILSALTAGNTVVLRPSTTTPYSALLLGEIMVEAGLPPGVLNIVVCRTPLAEKMITHPTTQAVMFTGSVGVGKRIMELASRNLTKLSLELGGKDPVIVLKDADLERAARGAVWAAFMNCGQSCGAAERIYVAAEVAAEFTDRVVTLTKSLAVGNPLDPGTDMGPMATAGQRAVVEAQIAEARGKGARILCGGGRIPSLPGHFHEPTVLSGVDHTMAVMTEETFGPALPIMTFAFPEEALELANDSIYGLTASVWTRNRKRASWFADRLEAGTVTVNDHMYSFVEPRAIWGGIKQTGLGRSHGPYGLLELLNIKYVSADYRRKGSQLWWFPYDETLSRTLEDSFVLFHGSTLGKKLGVLPSLLKGWPRIRATSPLSNFVKGLPRILRK
jgi:acyl-CoA reductase-like NAD-dependent aldehyde dehydrogenase